MKIRRLGVLLATAALAGPATAIGAASAAPEPEGPQPGSTTTTKIDDKIVFPKGYACNVPVEIHYTATETMGISKDGKVVTTISPDAVSRFTNLRTGKKVKRVTDGSFVDYVKGDYLKSWGHGRNTLAGAGVRGILVTGPRSVQRLNVYDFMNPEGARLEIRWIKGGVKQMCHTLGARAVRGKNPPLPEPVA